NRSFPNEKFFWFWWPVGLLKCAIKQWLSFALCGLAVPLHTGSSSIARAKLKLLKIRGISPRRLTPAPWHRQEQVKIWITYLVLKVLMQCLRSACTTRVIRKADVISLASAGALFAVLLIRMAVLVSIPRRRARLGPRFFGHHTIPICGY